ncbi:MAG TPA: ferredoxin oxidoreductase, partial [Firmicutes bacterium]|nr:ferredoxin oxidoreductase [Bacillota bacterium]
MEVNVNSDQRAFITGNEAVARAALAAGAGYLFGYPITPQNEIMHHWRLLAPEKGRGFLQTEDELSAGFATLGAVLSGCIAYSATAGPGTVLFQEPLSMAEAMRLPVVVAVQQRGGPSTATVIYSQQEVTLTCFGGNGEGLRVVYSTSSHQELYDYTIKAFQNAWKYRFPVIVLGDGYQAKMREDLVMYDPSLRKDRLIPNRPIIGGEGKTVHLQNAFSVEEELAEKLGKNLADYKQAAPELVEHEFWGQPGGKLLVVAHGIVGRAARQAVKELRAGGQEVNFFRPVTLRPFPEQALIKACQHSGSSVLVAESAEGQLGRLVRLALADQPLNSFRTLYRPGVGITSEEIRE